MTIASSGNERLRRGRPDTFAPFRPRGIPWRAFGVTPLALKMALVSVGSVCILLLVVLNRADIKEVAAGAVVESLLVKADALTAALAVAGRAQEAPLLRLVAAAEGSDSALATEVDRDEVERILSRTLEGTRTLAEVLSIDGQTLLDSLSALQDTRDVARVPLPPIEEGAATERSLTVWRTLFGPTPDLAADPDEETLARAFAAALGGVKAVERGERPSGDAFALVAAPIMDEAGRVAAVLRLVSPPGAINAAVRAHERAIVGTFVFAKVAAVLLSMIVALTITRPLSRLARAAESIKRGSPSATIPALNQPGEIGDLSRVLHEMTDALYQRINAIDAFAGEVAHELKNPLTSLRSAAETLPLAKTDETRARLIEVLLHDVQRIDRLITDISDASKLDAELNRFRFAPTDLTRLLRSIVEAQNDLGEPDGVSVKLSIGFDRGAIMLLGNKVRLGQLFTNLVENARSFSPPGGTVHVRTMDYGDFVEVFVDDEGPGVDEAVMSKIFERFYTDRPREHGFGQNSGLGLAICRQIAEAHRGEVDVENRYRTTLSPERQVEGARFVVRLPTMR